MKDYTLRAYVYIITDPRFFNVSMAPKSSRKYNNYWAGL